MHRLLIKSGNKNRFSFFRILFFMEKNNEKSSLNKSISFSFINIFKLFFKIRL